MNDPIQDWKDRSEDPADPIAFDLMKIAVILVGLNQFYSVLKGSWSVLERS
jgi:hypothetical protein